MSRLKHKIICGHVLDVLKTMPDESIDCIVTSPPYWGLRDYGEETNTIWGGNSNCEHEWIVGTTNHDNLRSSKVSKKTIVGSNKELRFRTGEKVRNAFCAKCGAWYGQLGLEPTLDLYLVHLWQITDELYRVLKKHGVMFWNHGDCYGTSGNYSTRASMGAPTTDEGLFGGGRRVRNRDIVPIDKTILPKCMALQNYRFILGLIDIDYRILVEWRAMGKPEGKIEEMLKYPKIQEILRNSIIWYKPNGMPSSVRDRFANKYEPVFMLTKTTKYWFDLDAVREPHKLPNAKSKNAPNKYKGYGNPTYSGFEWDASQHPLGKNPGDVWAIPTQPFPEAHFATFGEKLIEPMIKAGCPQWICKKCGKPRERTDCGCGAGWEAGVVLDPFAGSGTVGVVAERLGRNSILIDLNKEYCEMAYQRLKPLVAQTRLGRELSEIERIGF